MSRHLSFSIIVTVAMSILQTAQAANLELVDIATVDPTIVIDLRYATDHNVTGHALYPRGAHALILPSVAQQLAGAQNFLKQYRYRLKIWDAYRPKEAQELLWKYAHKDEFVADPEKGFGSMHSYGVSVDATLVDDWSQDVSMPTKFDEFTPQAMMGYTGRDPLVKQPRLDQSVAGLRPGNGIARINRRVFFEKPGSPDRDAHHCNDLCRLSLASLRTRPTSQGSRALDGKRNRSSLAGRA
jgi:D-alanyl-D-alanine dipeptidase